MAVPVRITYVISRTDGLTKLVSPGNGSAGEHSSADVLQQNWYAISLGRKVW
jgi:hypothetical protein